VTFVGRLATYKYYNMDQVVAQALAVYRKVLQEPSAVATIADPLAALEQPARRAASS
jgi:UDP-galactopyranose mutase